jgi:ribokinase
VSARAAASARAAPGLFVVGSINEDVVMELSRAVRPGETVLAERIRRFPGGKGANQAVAAAACGAAVAMVGAVGDDAAGERMLADLRRSGVVTDWVRVAEGTPTGTAYITVTPDGESTIVVDRGANALVGRDAIEAAAPALAQAKVLVSLLEIPVDTVAVAVRLALSNRVRPVVTLAPAQAVPADLLSGLDPLLVNEHEAAVLLDAPGIGDDVRAAARGLLALGPSSVVVTLGAAGAVVADAAGVRCLAAVPVEHVVDTTGAGDAFAGALAAALADGASLDAAVGAGHRAGAAAVGRPGAR